MSEHSIPRPEEKFHDAKKRFDTEIKALTKTAKGKQGKEQIAFKEKEVADKLAALKIHWDLFNRAENGEDVTAEYTQFSGTMDTPRANVPTSLDDMLANPMPPREVVLSKKQQKLLARDQRDEEEAKRIAAAAASLPDLCKDENTKINTKLKSFPFESGVVGGQFLPIPGDGHCLFRALIQQLNFLASLEGKKNLYECYFVQFSSSFLTKLKELYHIELSKDTAELTVSMMRRMLATWMILNPDDYLPFLFEHEVFVNGGDITDYAATITDDTKVLYGGEPEINAFTQLFNIPLTVVQAVGQNPQYNKNAKHACGTVVISFHAYWTTAGAHYNAVIPAVK